MGIKDLKIGNMVVDYLDEQLYNEDSVEIQRIYHYFDTPITYSSKDTETGQVYFNTLVDYIDGRDL